MPLSIRWAYRRFPRCHHCEEKDPVQPDQGRKIKDSSEETGGIPLKDPDTETGSKVSQAAAQNNHENATPAIPGGNSPDRFSTMTFMDDFQHIYPGKKAVLHNEKQAKNKKKKEKGNGISAQVKDEKHFGGIHQKQTEKRPDSPAEWGAQDKTSAAGFQGQAQDLPAELAVQSPAAHSQSQQDTGLPGFVPEKQSCRIEGKSPAADDGQNKNHHDLFPGIAALRQYCLDSGGIHHHGKGSDEKNCKKETSGQEQILPSPFLSQCCK